MSTGAILVMVLGILVLWGGLALSIINAIIKSKRQSK